MKLAVCGKGGSGKSTLTCLSAKKALRKNREVLVVDADDSNSGLYQMLGFENPPAPMTAMVGGKAKIKENMGKRYLLIEDKIDLPDIPSEFISKKTV